MNNGDKDAESHCTTLETYPEAVQTPPGISRSLHTMAGIKLYATIGSLTLVLFLAALDVLIISASIEVIAEQFKDYSKSGWIVSGYSLTEALLTLLWGRFATIIGFKSSLLVSILIFEAGSLISAISNSMNMLIGGRVVAGIGGSGIQSLCFVIASTLTSDRSRVIIISVLSCAYAIAAVVGPFLGGALTTHITWRWCFYINLPIGGLAFVVLAMVYNPSGRKSIKGVFSVTKANYRRGMGRLLTARFYSKIPNWLVFQIDFVGFVLCTAGFTLLLLGLTFGGSMYAWSSGTIIVWLVVGVLLITASLVYDFVLFPRFKQVRKDASCMPLLPWCVVSRPGIFTSNTAVFLGCIAYSAQIVYAVQFFQLVRGASAWTASIHLLSLDVSDIITVVIGGVVNRTTGHVKPILVTGVVAGVVGAGMLTLLNNESGSSKHIGLLILPGVASGATLQSSLLSCQLQIPKNSATFTPDFVSATTVHTFFVSLGMSFGSVLATTVFGASLRSRIASSGLDSMSTKSVDELVTYRTQNFDGVKSKLGYIFSDSIRNVFWMALGFCGLAFVFGIFTSSKKVNLEDSDETVHRSKEGGEEDDSIGKAETSHRCIA